MIGASAEEAARSRNLATPACGKRTSAVVAGASLVWSASARASGAGAADTWQQGNPAALARNADSCSLACVADAPISSQWEAAGVVAAGAQSVGNDIHIAQAESGAGARLARLRHSIEMRRRRFTACNPSKPKPTMSLR